MSSFKSILLLIFSMAGFVYCFYIVGRFMLFLSLPRNIPKAYAWVFYLLDNRSRMETAYEPVFFDTLYIIGFIIQHSAMKSGLFKKILDGLGLAAAERSIYCLTSSLCLNYLIKNWMPAQSIVLWYVDVKTSNALWWSFTIIHVFSWIVIYGGSIIMDLPEILGVKQVYYDLKGYSHPLTYKSFELRQLYAHVRHPSFTGLCIILWITNCMSLDRLILAILLTAYMYLAWSTDDNDFSYQRHQLKLKSQELKSQ